MPRVTKLTIQLWKIDGCLCQARDVMRRDPKWARIILTRTAGMFPKVMRMKAEWPGDKITRAELVCEYERLIHRVRRTKHHHPFTET